jgi:hypothetical protein
VATGAVARTVLARWALAVALAAAAACGPAVDSGADLRAQRDLLSRQVDGLREVVQRLERGEPLLPEGDMAIAIDDTLVRELILAQLPFDADVDRFHIRLADIDVQFTGRPTFQLRGRLQLREQPDVTAVVTVFGALDDITVDTTSSTLRARLAADQLIISEATGLAQYLSGATLEEIAHRIRDAIAAQLPVLRIPIAVRQELELPAVDDGPLHLKAGRLGIEAVVSQVVAARGRLWVSIHVTLGKLTTVSDASAAGPRP